MATTGLLHRASSIVFEIQDSKQARKARKGPDLEGAPEQGPDNIPAATTESQKSEFCAEIAALPHSLWSSINRT
jgi:hypothetical protein